MIILTFHYIIPHTPNMVTVIILDEKNKSLFHFLIILSLYTSNLQVNVKFTSSVSLFTLTLNNSCNTSL